MDGMAVPVVPDPGRPGGPVAPAPGREPERPDGGRPGGRVAAPPRGEPEPLPGRAAECVALSRLLTAAGAGSGGALVLAGDPGTGRTVLLERAAELAGGALDLHTAGVLAERRLRGAGLHRLLRPLRPLVDTLPR